MHRAALLVDQFSKQGLQNVSDKSSSWIVVHKQSKHIKPAEGYLLIGRIVASGSREIKYIDLGE
jgi:hypothetical protein